jgi:uncharacterized repeat protein (TIGR03833 family)
MFEEIKQLIEESKLQDFQNRNAIKIGTKVVIVTKQNQRTNNYNVGIVKRLLTSKKTHTRGIKVELTDGNIGRVQCVFTKNNNCSKFTKYLKND